MVQMLGHEPVTHAFTPLPMNALASNQPVLYRHHDEQMNALWGRWLKRDFDIAFSLLALCLTLPIYPVVMLLIYLEDGRPFFFGHRRETRGGEFFCWKFRSMRKEPCSVSEPKASRRGHSSGLCMNNPSCSREDFLTASLVRSPSALRAAAFTFPAGLHSPKVRQHWSPRPCVGWSRR